MGSDPGDDLRGQTLPLDPGKVRADRRCWPPVITVQHLTKRFGSHTAVDDLSFEVTRGEVLGFLGPNGAGKTTSMRMVTGYLPPSRGSVAIDGHDLLKRPIDAKRRIGYLPENPPLYPELTVRQFLGFVAEIKDVQRARRAAAVDRALQRANLGDVAGKRIGTLSKGFKQRVGLAQAIVHEPPVLVLDEPTSSLDPKQRVEVRDLIAALRGEHTVLLSTQILPRSEPGHGSGRHHQPRTGDALYSPAQSLATPSWPRRNDGGSRRRERGRNPRGRSRCRRESRVFRPTKAAS